MKARDIYENQTGKQAYSDLQPRKESQNAAYVEWLERIAEKAARMLALVPNQPDSIYDADDIEELANLYHQGV